MELTSKQKKYLKGLGHPLKPVIQIGKEGVSKKFVANLEDCLDHHELIKIKVLENAPAEKGELATKIEKKTKGCVAQIIGKTLLFYRPFKENPEIKLPKT